MLMRGNAAAYFVEEIICIKSMKHDEQVLGFMKIGNF